jgi:hypothetical protein
MGNRAWVSLLTAIITYFTDKNVERIVALQSEASPPIQDGELLLSECQNP